MTALVVDDSRAMRSIIRRMVEEVGGEVLQAGDGQEALSKLSEAGAVSVAIVDWNMPVMNGLEFVRAMRQNPAYKDVRVLMSTTETERERVREALAAGADDYIMKPFSKEAMRDKLAALGLVQEGA